MNSIISDPMRSIVTASRSDDGSIILRAPGKTITLTLTEFERLAKFAAGLGTMQRYVSS